MPRQSRKSPFDIDLDAGARQVLTQRLVDEIRAGKQARALHMEDGGLLDFAYSLYEQQSQQGISRDSPRYGSADLTSPIGTENVDTLVARATRAVFVEPLWITEGIGKHAPNAPVVEEYMQFRQEKMRFQKVAKRVFTAAFVETGSVFEVCEDAERCVKHVDVTAKVRQADDGTLVLDGKTGKPLPMIDEHGMPVPADDGDEATVEVHHAYPDYVRRGAYVRRRSMKDFLFLPSHAEDEREVWGHATRFYRSVAELRRREEDGEFDGVTQLGDAQEREQHTESDRQGIAVEYVPGSGMEEKELWKVQFWHAVKDDLCFVTAIVSEIHGVMLSLKYDWLGRYRTVYANPYPCPYSVYGYSAILTKLLTTIEEHTAWRNMNADRGTLKANAPMKRLHGAQWEPSIQPFGAGEVIDVGSMNEIMPFEFDDVSVQAMQKEQQCVADGQRIIGNNDIGIGQVSKASRTLGENQMATQASFVRTDDPINNLHEALEEVADLIHAIEVQALKDSERGMEAPAAVVEKIALRNADLSFDGTFTADMIGPVGGYRFKPRGSTENADPNRRQQVMVNGLGMLFGWGKTIPAIAERMQTPEFADAVMQWWADEFKPRDRQAFLKRLPPAQPPMGEPGMPPGPPGMVPSPNGPNFGSDELIQSLLANAGGQPS